MMSYRKLTKSLEKDFPEYKLIGTSIWRNTGTRIASGFVFERSRLDHNEFRVRAVILPLATSDGIISYEHSSKILDGRASTWRYNSQSEVDLINRLKLAMHSKVDFLSSASSIEQFLDYIDDSGRSVGFVNGRTKAYYSIYAGKTMQAEAILMELIDNPGMIRSQSINSIIEQMQTLLNTLQRDYHDAVKLLDKFCSSSRRSLDFI